MSDELQQLQPPGAETVISPPVTDEPTATFTPEPPGIDTSMPRILSIEIAPAHIDTLRSSQTVTITVHVTDDLSGFSYLALTFKPTSGGTQRVNLAVGQGGPAPIRDRVIVETMHIPQYSAYGRWVVSALHVQDRVSNSCGEVDGQEAAQAFPPCEFGIELPYFVNGEDSGPPVPDEVESNMYMPSVSDSP